LSKENTRSAPAEFGLAFPPTEDSHSEVDIDVVDGKATGSSDVGGKVALQRCHEVRPLPKGLDFGKPHHRQPHADQLMFAWDSLKNQS
jgi:hypothetical protein